MSLDAGMARRLALLLPRLASDADGEVLAAVAAVRRVLASRGLDLHDLAAALCREVGTAGWPDAEADDWPDAEAPPAAVARWCLASGRQWGSYEADFLSSMARRAAGRELTERQERFLGYLAWRCAGRRAA